MLPLQIVIDTNVLVSALRSKRGASYRLLTLVGSDDRFQINLSVPLVLEYEEVIMRPGAVGGLSESEISDVLNYLCLVGRRRKIFYLWRPYLKDPKDDMVLELAVESGSSMIVTFNVSDFAGSETFGVSAVTPLEFLRSIGELP